MLKRFIVTTVLCFSLAASWSGTNTDEKKILPYTISQKKFPNGMNVVTVPYESPGIAAFFIVMRVGSRDEVEPGKSGFAHFFEHMMFRGTEKYPREKYNEELKAIGASANANTSLDRTVYHMTGNAAMLDKMFMLEADRFMNLKYSLQDFKVEAGAVKGEYTKNSADPMQQLDEKMNDVAFTSHTYKHTTMGFFKDVVDMPNQYEYSQEFFKRFYCPEYATILVVGDVTPDKVNMLAQKYFGDWKHGNYVSNVPAEPQQKDVRYIHIKMDNTPPVLQMNFKIPAFSDKSMSEAALDVLSSVLFSEKSELYKKLVVKEQKLRRLGGDNQSARDPYLFSITATLKSADDMKYIRDEIVKAVEKIKLDPVDDKTLSDIKSRIKYGFSMRMNSPEVIANSLASFIWITGDPESLNRYYALINKVTPQDITKVAREYFNFEAVTYATISKDEESPVK